MWQMGVFLTEFHLLIYIKDKWSKLSDYFTFTYLNFCSKSHKTQDKSTDVMQLGPFGIVPSCVEEIESWKKRQSLNTQHHQCGQSVVKNSWKNLCILWDSQLIFEFEWPAADNLLFSSHSNERHRFFHGIFSHAFFCFHHHFSNLCWVTKSGTNEVVSKAGHTTFLQHNFCVNVMRNQRERELED